MPIGSTLKAYREKIGFTQEEVAAYLGIKRELLSYYENDEREASVHILESLANLFGVELNDFFETDKSRIATNVAFAFRASSMVTADHKEIAGFHKAVRNYLKIIDLEKANDQ